MWVGSSVDAFSEKRFKDRIRFLTFLFSLGTSLLVLRLFYLQVVRGDDFAQVSESNRTQTIFLNAPRGVFTDQDQNVIVSNRPSWALMYSVSPTSKESIQQVGERLQPFLKPFSTRWRKRLKRAFKSKQLVRLVEDVPPQVAFGMREMGELLPGLRMEMEFRRDYPKGVQAIQLLGYLSEIDEKELKDNAWFSRKPGDLIGKMGLEKILDAQLRGVDGGMLIEVDSIGRLKRVIRELPYRKGHSIQLTLNSKLQDLAEQELAKTPTKRGAVVVLDVQSGAVRVWASAPTFNPSESLADDVLDENLPFFDRIYKGAYPPGSVYKVITALAGFQKGAIQLSETITCQGFVALEDRRLKVRRYGCWKRHGEVDFWKAMKESCDSYFYLLSQKIGPQPIYEMSRDFGMGGPVQATLPNENHGIIPNASWKKKKGLGGWSTGDSYNMSIGQGYVTTTPLQIAVMMAGVTNRGKVVRPYMIERILDDKGSPLFEARPGPLQNVNVDSVIWDRILRSIHLVVSKGTGRASYVPHLLIRGKTGTAQNPHGEDHAWFMASGGYKDQEPSLAVCVFVENGGNGGSVAAPIARKIFEAALPPVPPKGTI